MVEHDHRGLIAVAQAVERSPRGRLEVFQAGTDHALAPVQHENHVEGPLLEAHEIDRLGHAVVAHHEVRRAKPADHAVTLGDERVDAHGLHAGGEGGLAGGRRFSPHDGGCGNRAGHDEQERSGHLLGMASASAAIIASGFLPMPEDW